METAAKRSRDGRGSASQRQLGPWADASPGAAALSSSPRASLSLDDPHPDNHDQPADQSRLRWIAR